MMMGPLGCFTFLTGENVLGKSVIKYAPHIAEDIFLELSRAQRKSYKKQ